MPAILVHGLLSGYNLASTSPTVISNCDNTVIPSTVVNGVLVSRDPNGRCASGYTVQDSDTSSPLNPSGATYTIYPAGDIQSYGWTLLNADDAYRRTIYNPGGNLDLCIGSVCSRTDVTLAGISFSKYNILQQTKRYLSAFGVAGQRGGVGDSTYTYYSNIDGMVLRIHVYDSNNATGDMLVWVAGTPWFDDAESTPNPNIGTVKAMLLDRISSGSANVILASGAGEPEGGWTQSRHYMSTVGWVYDGANLSVDLMTWEIDLDGVSLIRSVIEENNTVLTRAIPSTYDTSRIDISLVVGYGSSGTGQAFYKVIVESDEPVYYEQATISSGTTVSVSIASSGGASISLAKSGSTTVASSAGPGSSLYRSIGARYSSTSGTGESRSIGISLFRASGSAASGAVFRGIEAGMSSSSSITGIAGASLLRRLASTSIAAASPGKRVEPGLASRVAAGDRISRLLSHASASTVAIGDSVASVIAGFVETIASTASISSALTRVGVAERVQSMIAILDPTYRMLHSRKTSESGVGDAPSRYGFDVGLRSSAVASAGISAPALALALSSASRIYSVARGSYPLPFAKLLYDLDLYVYRLADKYRYRLP